MHFEGFSIVALLLLSMHHCGRCLASREKSFSTSIAGMEQLLAMEQTLIASVEQFTEELQSKLTRFKNLLFELQEENRKGLESPEEYLHNPLNGFSLIRRMYYDWPNIELYMTKPVGKAHVEVIQKLRTQMPTSTDLQEASEAIYRLQITYGLEPMDMAEGILNGKQYDVQMKPIDRYFMGYYLFAQADYYHSAYWTYEAIMSYGDSEYYEMLDFNREKVYTLYAETLMKQNRASDALIAIQHAYHTKPQDARLLKRRNEIEFLANTTVDGPKEFLVPDANPYEMGCRGLYSNVPSRFHCHYNTTMSPFLRLAPLKMEILKLEPYMVLYHDVITDKEIEELKDLARPQLKRAAVYNEDNDRPKVVNTRTAKSSGFNDFESNATMRVNQRIRDMTGFDTGGSEVLQVMNYGLGGHYDTHYDFFNVSSTSEVVRVEGDRIATVLIYMSDVEQGGATVFPNIDTAVFPRKGSALMWYNLRNDLEGDWRTLHAACPVLVGSKWVCNKWIRANAQTFRRPCYK